MEDLNNFEIFALYLPIGLIGLWRWSVFVIKKLLSLKYKAIKGSYKASLSIVTPVYNENPKMFRLALKSWFDNNPNEIIAVIDYTDKKCIKIFNDFKRKFSNQKNNKTDFILYITKRPGKREALEDGVRIAKHKIIALVDSDTVWSKEVKKKLLAPFKDKSVGGVSPRQDVLRPNTLARKLFKIHLFNRFYNELTFLAATGDGLTCLSGRTAVYRSKAIKGLMDEMVNETFWGKKCISGDDKALSHLVLKNGWKQRYLYNALVYTPGSESMSEYSKQLVRWTRNSWRADLKAIFQGWIFKHKFLTLHLFDRFISPFTLLLGPIFFIYSITHGYYLLSIILIIWWFLSRSLKISGHLIENPKDIALIPVYILFTFYMGIIKIYTLLTVSRQSWVTRWDKSRLLKLDFLKAIVPPTTTVFIIFTMAFGVFYINSLVSKVSKNSEPKKAAQNELIDGLKIRDGAKSEFIENQELEEKRNNIVSVNESDPYGYYKIKEFDTIASVQQKFAIKDIHSIKDRDKNPLFNNRLPATESQILIPVNELRTPFKDEELQVRGRPQITYDNLNNVIYVKGRGSVVTISSIYNRLRNNNILEKVDNKVWFLKASLDIGDDVILKIDGKEIGWLKLKSDIDDSVYIKSENGGIFINNAKITSWDEHNNDYDRNPNDDRSYILQKNSGRMDILNSEIAYLGNFGFPKRGAPFGGPYGIAWKIKDNSLHSELVTGAVKNNKIHNNLFGLYTYGATGIIFENNEVYDNIEYGIDPHDDSNNLLIENNYVYNNGTHGIITSKRCYNNLIIGNISINNQLHGIMLHRKSNNNIVINNVLTGNTDGMAIYDSHANLIVNNTIENNKQGIRNNRFSSGNVFIDNDINENQKGIYFYDEAAKNYVGVNEMSNDQLNFDMKDGVVNYFTNDLKINESDGKKEEN